jgi:hypothetical protein
MKTFWLTAALGDAGITTMVRSDKVDELVSDWETAGKKIGGDIHAKSRNLVIAALLENKQADEEDGKIICQALLWLLVNGPLGERLLPFLRRGGPNVKVHQEITEVADGPENARYNFRTTVDDETGAQMSV